MFKYIFEDKHLNKRDFTKEVLKKVSFRGHSYSLLNGMIEKSHMRIVNSEQALAKLIKSNEQAVLANPKKVLKLYEEQEEKEAEARKLDEKYSILLLEQAKEAELLKLVQANKTDSATFERMHKAKSLEEIELIRKEFKE